MSSVILWLVPVETHTHMQLKRLAHAWLLREGFQAVAAEVRAPIMRYRADVAGYIDAEPYKPSESAEATHDHLEEIVEPVGGPVGGQRILPFDPTARPASSRKACEPRTIIVECKQSRADFLRDTAETDRLLAQRRTLLDRKHAVEHEFIKRTEPDLRATDQFLFHDMEHWDFSRSRSPAYKKLLGEIASIDSALYNQTKFFWMAQYRMADRLFLIAPRAMIKPRELPDGWGLIEVPRRLADSLARASLAELGEVPLVLRTPARDNHTRGTHRMRLLRNIAVAATRSHVRAESRATSA